MNQHSLGAVRLHCWQLQGRLGVQGCGNVRKYGQLPLAFQRLLGQYGFIDRGIAVDAACRYIIVAGDKAGRADRPLQLQFSHAGRAVAADYFEVLGHGSYTSGS